MLEEVRIVELYLIFDHMFGIGAGMKEIKRPGSILKTPQEKRAQEVELKKLRYNYHRTAFDIDIDELDKHPWRDAHIDISDYFNFGFTEATWLVRIFI